MTDTNVVIGIDVAAVRPSTAVAVRMARRPGRGGGSGSGVVGTVIEWMEADHRRPDQVDALMAWIGRHEPAVVGIDAPQDFKSPRRRPAGTPARGGKAAATATWQRACDRELLARRIRLYPVPSKDAVASGEARLPDWMGAGFDYFRRLRRAGFETPEQAVMPGMLGGPPAVIEVYPYGAFVALLGGLPPNKGTRAGQRLRVVALRRAGLEWDEYTDGRRYQASQPLGQNLT